MTLFWVALGGAVGTTLRFLLNLGTLRMLGMTPWPYATLMVNVVGSLLLGIVMEAGAGRTAFGADVRLVLGTGMMGGFTTYSSFSVETIRLIEQHALGRACAYVIGTTVVCLLSAAVGVALGRALRAQLL